MTTGLRTILAFDYGTKRIGVAVGQELTKTATALITINNSPAKFDWKPIDQLIQDWQPQALVVGLPLNADGSEHEITQAAKRFGDQLQKRYNLATYWMDERLTSAEAESMIAAGRSRKKAQAVAKGDVDKTAAKLILESWFNQQI